MSPVLFLILVACLPVSAIMCACPACQSLVLQEFQPGAVNCAKTNASSCTPPACSWHLLDIQWCAAPSGNGLYSLTTNGFSGGGCPYTNDCKVCLEGGGNCEVVNATGAVHPVAPKDIGLATAAVFLELFHFLTIVVFKYNEVVLLNICQFQTTLC